MRVLAIVHQPDAGPGVFSDALRAAGAELEEWSPPNGPAPRDPLAYAAVITLGGAMHVDQEREHPWLVTEKELLGRLLERGVPQLGVCLGAQLLSEVAGGGAARAAEPEIGWYEVRITPQAGDDPVLGPLAPGFPALEWHSYEFSLPPAATPLARSQGCLQAFRLGAAWGIQFHAETTGADLRHWIDDYRSDPDAVAAGLDPDSFRGRSDELLPTWNELGRDLCGRFLEAARASA